MTAAVRALPDHPALLPLRPLLDQTFRGPWPDLAQWNLLARAQALTNLMGLPIIFVPPSLPPGSALDFEHRIYSRGEIETRPECWHDAFHALTWLTFPRAKARINALHVADGLADSPNRRSVLRNVLTLIDEGGLLVAVTSSEQERLLRGFAWHALFWDRRDQVRQTMDFVIFGHALNERALDMPHGITGRGVLIEVAPGYFNLDMAGRVAHLDARLCAILDDHATLTAQDFLQPVPLKGIPGWATENLDETYYTDTSQFCTGRRGALAC